MKKSANIPARLKKLEDEMRGLRALLQQEREETLRSFPDPLEVLVATVVEQAVAFPIRSVLEVLPRVYLQAIPESPGYLAGFLNWRGTPVPVIDPSAKWGGDPLDVRLEDRILIFTTEEGPRALLLSSVEQVIRISHAQMGKIPAEIPAAPYALAMWQNGETQTLLLAAERLIDPAELARYAAP